MKIKLDENIPADLVDELAGIGHEADTVHSEGLVGRADVDVFEAAQLESRFLITQDLDFSDIRRFAPGSHAGLMLLRLHEPDRRSIVWRVMQAFASDSTRAWSGCFVVVTETKVRVVRPRS